ncbi:MAG: DNA/RNA non-specific endonuclease [Spirochaetales bacterium]|nr:DNA/RNA non-specific endonuclease [Spirochaetales bacterium]
MKKILLTIITTSLLFSVAGAPRPVVFDSSYEHDKWETKPVDHRFEFAAYTGSFDTDDDNNGDGVGDIWGIPEWVSYEIKALEEDYPLASRPGWMTDEVLFSQGLAPDDDTYRVSGTRTLAEVKTNYRFVRGHMCPKDAAERISADAAYNTHTMLNAVPQLQSQNNGIWKELEQHCTDWADEYNRIWVICGPVFFAKTPSMWLGQDDEFRAAIPDALFKIVARQENDNSLTTIAFVIPNILTTTETELADYITTIDRLESLTGLDFFTAVDWMDDSFELTKGYAEVWDLESSS